MTKLYIVHGYQADASKHWFPWLKQSLEIEGHDVEVLNLPNSHEPHVEEWLTYMRQTIPEVDADTIFVAHSLGVITTLKFLNDLDVSKVGGLAIVSGFKDKLEGIETLDAFIEQEIDFDQLKHKIIKRFGIASKTDDIVPYTLTAELCKALDAKFYLQEEGGHFLEKDGYDTFLFLRNKILNNFD
ncbi:serine hydrolase family protein [Staphylococcus pseudintermedius]|nr:serine hydrolase family protein [Staphylococcus pseudintermedius]